MPSYQDAQLPADPTGQWLAFTAAVAVSPDTRDRLAHAITAHRAKIGTRWRLLDPTTQATLVIAFLRTNLTYAELAAGNHISTSTCWRYIQEGITLLAGRAMRLKDVVRLARKAGWDYLLVDGVNVPTVAFGRKLNRRQKHYSGKHLRPRRPAAVGLSGATGPHHRHHRRPPPQTRRQDRQADRPAGGPGLPRPGRGTHRIPAKARREATARRETRREQGARQPALSR